MVTGLTFLTLFESQHAVTLILQGVANDHACLARAQCSSGLVTHVTADIVQGETHERAESKLLVLLAHCGRTANFIARALGKELVAHAWEHVIGRPAQ